MKLAMVFSNTDPETISNALRLDNFAVEEGDGVNIFLLGKGVELDQSPKVQCSRAGRSLSCSRGDILACGTCLKLWNSEGSDICPLSTMKHLYEMVTDADKALTF